MVAYSDFRRRDGPPMAVGMAVENDVSSISALATSPDIAPDEPIFLSTKQAGRSQHRLALAVVLFSALCFAAALPFARTPLPKIPAFIAAYESALAINDLLTAVLLFGLFRTSPDMGAPGAFAPLTCSTP